MLEIFAHEPPSTEHSESDLANSLSRIAGAPDRILNNPKGSGMLLGRYLEAAVLAEQLGEPREVTLECLRLALDAGVAAFALAVGSGTVDIVVTGKQLSARATGPTDIAHAATWQDLFGLTLAMRVPAASDAICAVDIDVLRRSPAKLDEYRYDMVDAMQKFWTGGDWRASAALVEKRAQPQFTKVAGREYVDVDLTQVRMLEPLATKDAAGFDKALAAALEAHKRYWSSEQWRGRVIGLIAIGPLGLAALAHDRGIASNVSSGYLPPWLLRGELTP